jgi:hypothetical protein
MGGSGYSSEHILVLITAIRKLISGSEDPPVDKILKTNILDIISHILKLQDGNEEVRHMKVRKTQLS